MELLATGMANCRSLFTDVFSHCWIELSSLLFPSIPRLRQGWEDAGGDQVSSVALLGPALLPAAVRAWEPVGAGAMHFTWIGL